MKISDIIVEAPLADYEPIGDFNKPGAFRQGVDKRLVTHEKNKLKTAKFFQNTQYDMRLFFSNISGTGKYAETGDTSPENIKKIFGEYADQILKGHENAITVVFVGNSGADRVMITPWIMAHRFGHAIQASNRMSKNINAWKAAEKHFFSNVNSMLEEYYGKSSTSRFGVTPDTMRYDLTPEYNALFNAIGTQRSSRTNQIKRPYEFLYELFAQYLKDGKITLNSLPVNLTYGRQAWGKPSKFMNLNPEFNNETDRNNASGMLARDMEIMFSDVLSGCVGKIFVM